MIAILSQSCSASSILCVDNNTDEFLSCFTILSKDLLETGSTPVVGSSRNSTSGQTKSVYAQHSFLLLPPLRLPARVSIKSQSSSVSKISLLFLSLSSLLNPFIRAIKLRLSSTVNCSHKVLYYGHNPMYDPWSSTSMSSTFVFSTFASPLVFGTSRHIMLNVVDFPAPFGPRSPKISPFLMPKEFPQTACMLVCL